MQTSLLLSPNNHGCPFRITHIYYAHFSARMHPRIATDEAVLCAAWTLHRSYAATRFQITMLQCQNIGEP